jgi:uncharacterized protein with LGFP repeats
MDAKLLESAKVAETSLRRREIEKVVGDVPDGHPLKKIAQDQMAGVGDMADLPDGHPLILAIKAATERYELNEARKSEQARVVEVRKAKRLEQRQVQEVQRQQESEQRDAAMKAADAVNDRIAAAADAVKALIGSLEDGMVSLKAMPETRVGVMRLERLAGAALAGLASSRLRVRRA